MPSGHADGGWDTAFGLPALDDPPSTEAGVILMGLDADHLLAGLAVAGIADDPAAVTLLVDQARHAGAVSLPVGRLVAAGIARWQRARAPLLAAAGGGPSAAPRRAWEQAYRAVDAAAGGNRDLGEIGPASAVYLTACLLRHADIDRYCAGPPG